MNLVQHPRPNQPSKQNVDREYRSKRAVSTNRLKWKIQGGPNILYREGDVTRTYVVIVSVRIPIR